MPTMHTSTGCNRRRAAVTKQVAVCILVLLFLAVASAAQTDTPSNDKDDGSLPFPGIPSIPDDPDTIDKNCRLLGPFALFTQAFMAVVVIGSLVLKRHRERPKRPWKIWLLDISKQMLGQLFVHTLNVILSSVGSSDGMGGEDNPCSLYFLNIGIDTTIGVLFIYYSMRHLTYYFTDVLGWTGFVSGQYTSIPTSLEERRASSSHHHQQQQQQSTDSVHDATRTSTEQHPAAPSTDSNMSAQRRKASKKPRLSFFFRQLALYLLSLLLMKVCVLILFAIFPFLFDIGRWVLNLFGEHKRAQIIFVMALFPMAMNTLQFWLIDSVLRHNPNTSKYRSDEDDEYSNGAIGNIRQDGFQNSGGYTDDEGDLENGEARHDRQAEHTASGPWTAAWWSNMLHSNEQNETERGNYHEVGRHSIGEASASTEAEEEDEGHTYPPIASQSSSIAQLDVTTTTSKANGGIQQQQQPNSASDDRRGSAATLTAYGATARSPSLESKRHEHAQDVDDEEEEAWDAWGDDDEGGANDAKDEQDAARKIKKTD